MDWMDGKGRSANTMTTAKDTVAGSSRAAAPCANVPWRLSGWGWQW
jgi:hypothetical protein